MTLKRRAFLQQTGLALGALGIGGTALLASSSQYQQALAKPARRKLALLIGINAYPDRALDPGVAQDIALKGCITDVELQRHLLVNRFGFQPGDVVTLTNQDATRDGILTAIDEHLVQQARADDVVLLHFSGYGSQVRVAGTETTAASQTAEADPNKLNPSGLQTAWVTVDSHLPSENNPALGDLLEAEIVAWLAPLATANLTTVIDAGSQDAGYLRWGNSRVRSRPTVPTGLMPAAKFPLNLAAPWPGLLLRAAEPGRLVLESHWEGFSAGVFTYALTQSLWEAEPDPTVDILVRRTGQRLHRWVGADQQPSFSDRRSPRTGPVAYSLPPQMPPASGVVLPSGNNRPLTAWLGGVPSQVLRYLQPGSCLVVESAAGQSISLGLESRTGLKAVVKPLDGQVLSASDMARRPLFEQVRRLPLDIDLIVALDSQLKRVERVDATSALAGIPLVTSVTAGEKAADCLFGRLPIGPNSTLTAALPNGESIPGAGGDRPSESSYGLFAPNRTLLPGTMLVKEEAVKTAVNRLTPYLQTLLALKLVRLTENRTTSQLGAAAALETVQPKPKSLLVQTTERSATMVWPSAIRQAQKAAITDTVTLSRDSRIAYHLANTSTQPLHLLWISFDSRGKCTALMTLPDPTTADGAEVPQVATPVAPGEMLTFPTHSAGWAMPGSAIWVESHVILSTQPLDQCLAVLGNNPPAVGTGFRPVRQSLRLAQALLRDLSASSAVDGRTTDSYSLHHDRWATLSFRYNIA
ncbi:MAG: caspase family protein [Nodosilinea sp.]